MKINKKEVCLGFIKKLEEELQAAKAAAQATYEAATHEENKPENEYDTRGLEASYLAGAQAERAQALDEVLSLFKNMNFETLPADSPVRTGALVEVDQEGRSLLFLVMPQGGATSLDFKGRTIQVITPQSVVGSALIGLKKGDSADVQIGNNVREYEITSVI